jgi:DNA-binding transcriptional regulator GbsR (MarR family)
MTQQPDPVRDEFINEAGELASSLGLSRAAGQLYALLYMSPTPLCLDEMAEACQMSKGNASINVRELERWGAAIRTFIPGDRKDYYEANRDVPGIVVQRLKIGLGRRLASLEAAIESAAAHLDTMKNDPARRKFYAERLQEVRSLHRSLKRIVDNLDKFYAMGKRFL